MRESATSPLLPSDTPTIGNVFFTYPAPASRADAFHLEQGGLESCQPHAHFNQASRENCGLELILAGNGTLICGEEARPLFTGHLLLHDRTTRSEQLVASDTELTKCWIEFSGVEAEKLFADCRKRAENPILLADFSDLRALFLQIIRIGDRGSPHAQHCINSLLEVLLFEIQNAIETEIPAEVGASYQTYQRCWQHLEKNFLNLSSASELAHQTHVNAAYLSRLFNRFDTEQPYRKLMRLKMEGAARLVSEGQMLVKEVATAVGIEDQLHFSRLFKRHFGVSPRAYRKHQVADVDTPPTLLTVAHARAS